MLLSYSNAVPAARRPNYLKSAHVSQCLLPVPHFYPTGFTSLWGAFGAPHLAPGASRWQRTALRAASHAAKDFRRIIGSYPEVNANCVNLKVHGLA